MATLVQLVWWMTSITKARLTASAPADIGGLSILICSHNMENALRQNLEGILTQFEGPVHVVDHGSEDGTAHFLDVLANRFDQLIRWSIPRTFSGKKEALQFGLDQISTKYVLLTDADCTPRSDQWSNLMFGCLEPHALACIGISPLRGGSTGAGRFAAYDALLIALGYAYRTVKGKPYMAVGRNLLVETDEMRGALKKDDRKHLGGDDDLAINEIKKRGAISICLDPMAVTYSPSPSTWKEVWDQRRRHLATSHEYDFRDQWYLLMLSASHWMHLSGVLLLIFLSQCGAAFSLYFLRLIVLYWGMHRFAVPLHGSSLLPWIPLLDLFYLFYYPLVALLLTSRSKQTW
ncbi:MAG: glycosyltransferase [Saprospiraceae bacterium]|nr:glycosyltransferase [Saprospiraceae bacterium]